MTLRSLKGTLKTTVPELTRSLRTSVWDPEVVSTADRDNPLNVSLLHDLENLKLEKVLQSLVLLSDTTNGFIALDESDAITNIGAVYTVNREFYGLCNGNLFRVNTGTDTEGDTIRLEISATEYSMFQTLDIKDGTTVASFEGTALADGVINISDIKWLGDSFRIDIENGRTNIGQAPTVPSGASSSGVAGDFCFDSGYLYICISANTWKRVAVATW